MRDASQAGFERCDAETLAFKTTVRGGQASFLGELRVRMRIHESYMQNPSERFRLATLKVMRWRTKGRCAQKLQSRCS